MKKTIFILTLILIFSSIAIYAEEDIQEIPYLTEKAIVLEAGDVEGNSEDLFGEQFQKVKLKIISGKYKDELFEI